jgi:hypothetical protein
MDWSLSFEQFIAICKLGCERSAHTTRELSCNWACGEKSVFPNLFTDHFVQMDKKSDDKPNDSPNGWGAAEKSSLGNLYRPFHDYQLFSSIVRKLKKRRIIQEYLQDSSTEWFKGMNSVDFNEMINVYISGILMQFNIWIGTSCFVKCCFLDWCYYSKRGINRG